MDISAESWKYSAHSELWVCSWWWHRHSLFFPTELLLKQHRWTWTYSVRVTKQSQQKKIFDKLKVLRTSWIIVLQTAWSYLEALKSYCCLVKGADESTSKRKSLQDTQLCSQPLFYAASSWSRTLMPHHLFSTTFQNCSLKLTCIMQTFGLTLHSSPRKSEYIEHRLGILPLPLGLGF